MKYILTRSFTIIFLLIIAGCNNTSNTGNTGNTDLTQLVQDWNKAHSSKDAGTFSNLFHSTVLFYGTQQDKNACIESKLAFFKKHPDFYQQIFGNVETEKISDTEMKCSFVKRVTMDKVTSDYPSYLTFKKIDNSWKIVTEGDLVTDKNLSKKNEAAPAANQQDYGFEPSVSVISGKIRIESFFGPPGYGESPETDSREDSYILVLDNPINVVAKGQDTEDNEFNTTTLNISKIQLTSTHDVKLTNYKNKAVKLTGTFFGAHTGHHHTDVLLDVEKAEEL